MTTDELMVTRMQDQFAFLKECTNEEIKQLKREISSVMGSGFPSERPSPLLARVNVTLREFKENAQQGEMTRDYHEATEAIEVCACCCGLIHGESYWGE